MAMSSTDRIEKRVILRAARARVFRAIADAEQFGVWFRVKLDGPFVESKTVHGKVTYPGYEHLSFEAVVERIQPESYFAFRWHPHAVDPTADYSDEPMTLVEFRLEEVPEGTALSIVESGFDKIPLARRAEAFRMNDGGWAEQCKNIEQYVKEG